MISERNRISERSKRAIRFGSSVSSANRSRLHISFERIRIQVFSNYRENWLNWIDLFNRNFWKSYGERMGVVRGC